MVNNVDDMSILHKKMESLGPVHQRNRLLVSSTNSRNLVYNTLYGGWALARTQEEIARSLTSLTYPDMDKAMASTFTICSFLGSFSCSVHALEHMPVFEEVVIQLLSTALEEKVMLKFVMCSFALLRLIQFLSWIF